MTEPNDWATIRKLLNVLDSFSTTETGIGKYSDCQRRLYDECQSPNYFGDILSSRDIPGYYKKWQSLIDTMDVSPPIPISQLLVGNLHYIGGEFADCELRFSLFEEHKVISEICTNCYKVQILPADVLALMNLYIIMREIELPRDNARKCMVELRNSIPYPYKGYIYCESEDEAVTCSKMLVNRIKDCRISSILVGISHGCSEFSQTYPAFKYSEGGTHRMFEVPRDWKEKERAYLSARPRRTPTSANHNKFGISVRDVIGFRTWIDYAEIIGDQSAAQFRFKSSGLVSDTFLSRVRSQAAQRRDQLLKLKEKLRNS